MDGMTSRSRITIGTLLARKREGQKISMITCYDYSTARILEESGVQLAFTTLPGVNDVRRSDRLRLRRVHVGARTGLAGLRAQLLGFKPAT